jgi:hypothetical protein
MTFAEVWERLVALSCPAGQPRVIPASMDGEATVSPLTAEGDAFWAYVVFAEPFPEDQVRLDDVRRQCADRGLFGEAMRAQLELASQEARASLQAQWWAGRQCFWHPQRQTDWYQETATVFMRRIDLYAYGRLLRELDQARDFSGVQLPLF